ncbi:restriction endonuclease [Desulfovibrio litoralis]|uniref:Restriction system protein n=1 Tax=Desulfovibrio litoralis DSM 11393 TaxID=1121455 RepID=A0A1M7TDI7_9BACT|nr:restriction endonuclease [Desulfovibrio litoralis]SHN68782.1 restriction system protein [Desulfovibrio litoralis DSM 11393]
MAVPDFQSIMLPLLKLSASVEQLKNQDARAVLAREFRLSTEDLETAYQSSGQNIFNNRVAWAFAYLKASGLLKKEGRGSYSITDKGKECLKNPPEKITVRYLTENYGDLRKKKEKTNSSPSNSIENQQNNVNEDTCSKTPEELLEDNFTILNSLIKEDLYEKVVNVSNDGFERLIIELMKGLGYGSRGLAKRVGGAGDGGIDGIITEDLLGLDTIYLQAKRYARGNNIAADKIREFVGAMDGKGVNKGVFVTTSDFTKAALESARQSHKSLKLINGNELTSLMLEHGIGTRTYKIFKLQRIDEDFFDNLDD